jgi:hypothetical protein
MKPIVLDVDDGIEKIYNGLSDADKHQIKQLVSRLIKKAANDGKFAEYSKLLDETGNEAIRNGLTPELLEALLASVN